MAYYLWKGNQELKNMQKEQNNCLIYGTIFEKGIRRLSTQNFNHISEKIYHCYRTHVIGDVWDKNTMEFPRFCFQFLGYLV